MLESIEQFLGIKAGNLSAYLLDLAISIGVAILILIIGFWVAKMASKAVVRILQKRGSDQSLIGFMRSLVSATIKILVVVTAITQLGVQMTSFVALLGAAGLAIGLAFSGTLSNFAGGVMILLFKPFKAGDFVDVQGEQGVVKEVQIFNTILTTTDNKIIFLANGAVSNGTIINYTKADKRRLEWTFSISYGDDLKKAKELLSRFLDEDERILNDEEKFVGVGALADSSVNLTVRSWVGTDDYWPVFFAINERVYLEFGDAGLSIPFPQLDVHVQKEA